jgi:hypothetical protein
MKIVLVARARRVRFQAVPTAPPDELAEAEQMEFASFTRVPNPTPPAARWAV